MKTTRTGKQIHAELDGSIGDTTPLFTLRLEGTNQLTLDMTKVTSINSIGVKHWILWTLRIPKDCQVSIVNCPYVIASQASIVMGFTTPNIKIESFRAPYICDGCGNEEIHLIVRGKDYEYPVGGLPAKLSLPADLVCIKCRKGKLEPDFLVEKTFKFLK
ncbi:MAG: hypothetical protein ACXVA9_02375 [Bdellovibrionales bacterium]